MMTYPPLGGCTFIPLEMISTDPRPSWHAISIRTGIEGHMGNSPVFFWGGGRGRKKHTGIWIRLMIFDVDFSNQWSYGIPCGWSENHPVLWHKTWIIKICQNPNQFIWTWLLDVHFVSWWSLHVWFLNHLFEWLLSSESTWYSTSSILSENAPVMAIIFRRQTTGVLSWPKKHVGYQSYINHMCVCVSEHRVYPQHISAV